MPTYVFTCEDCGESVEHVCSMAAVPESLRCQELDKDNWEHVCGGTMRYDWRRTHAGSHRGGDKEYVSAAVGVQPEQRDEAYRESVAMGVPTQFNEDGDAVFTSRKHRRDYCRAMGFRDNDAGYGDWAGE